jgi:two-component system, OmpR family, sensor histidine kinase KdpD
VGGGPVSGSRQSSVFGAPILRAVGAAVVLPVLATALMLIPSHLDTTIAALVYMLVVIGAAAAGGLVVGVIASLLSFLGLNFFFTEPLRTLRVEKIEDVVALGVFVIVSIVVATLYTSATRHRAIAERGERETRLLYDASRHLMAGRPERDVLEEFATAAVRMFDLRGVEIRTEAVPDPVVVGSPDGTGSATVPIATRDRELGRIVMAPPAERAVLDPGEEAVFRAFAGQIALHEEGERLAREARGARMDAETSDLRAALFSSVTHELRTPLASITASVTNLLDLGGAVSEADRIELLETIRDEAHRLNRLVGNLLDLARVRAGAVTPARRLGSINDVIEGVGARINKRIGRVRVQLVLRDVPETWLDLDQMDQVVTNLIENALMYARPDSDVRVTSVPWHDAVEVRVIDQGPGIPAEDRERVFEPFVRGDTDREGGSGLGLAIARAFVEAHGGTIWIEGTPGGGATFVFRLPKGP